MADTKVGSSVAGRFRKGGDHHQSTIEQDREHLHGMGYAQELKRGMGTFSNFAISFSIISILAGGWTGFWIGMDLGGPFVIFWGWIIVGFFVLLVGMAMGEICSAYPTAGGLYYWSAKLAKRNAPVWSWFAGWFNLLGQIGVIASVDYALASFTGFFIGLYDDGFHPTARTVFVIYLVMLVAHGLLNTFGVKLVRMLGDISVWWHVAGVVVIFGVLLIAPSHHQPVSFLFDHENLSGWNFPGVGIYVFLVGLLLAQYTITGFDASAHVSEETVGARTGAPKAIVRSIYISAIAAFVMNIAMVLAIPKGSDAYAAIAGNGINAAPALMVAALSSAIAKFLILISIVGQFFCGMASVTANSRMIYAFSRDGALPGSSIWHKINKRTRTPTNSVWLGVGLSALVGTISLYQNNNVSVAFFALTGICVVGLYIAYVIPVFLRLRSDTFVPGPWNLGRWSKAIGWTSVVWVAIITVLFFSPLFYPFWPPFDKANLNNVNFAGPLIVGAAALFGVMWVAWAKNWFRGPKVQGTKEELMAIELELGELEAI